MARMLAKTRLMKVYRCCDHCPDRTARWQHGSRKDPRFRKIARAADNLLWKKEL